MATTTKGLRGTEAQAKTRLLLALWDIGGEKVKKKALTDRALLNNERVGDYTGVFEQLAEAGAIAVETEKRVAQISLTDRGLQLLAEGLKKPEFVFDGMQIKARDKDANALLKWIREMGTLNGAATASGVQGQAKDGAISSYDKFKPEALTLFEKLDTSYNYSGLVPIWHLRRQLGERVSREEFTDWMMEMQAEQLFYLQSGEARGATDDQKRDSINDEVRGLLFFASQPS